MAKAHEFHTNLMNAFETADRNTPRDKAGNANYGMGANGMPRTAAQQASVKKAAQASAQARGQRAKANVGGPARTPDAPNSLGAGLSAGGLALAKKGKGLLGM